MYSASRSVDYPAIVSSEHSAATHDAKAASSSTVLALATAAVINALSVVNAASRSANVAFAQPNSHLAQPTPPLTPHIAQSNPSTFAQAAAVAALFLRP